MYITVCMCMIFEDYSIPLNNIEYRARTMQYKNTCFFLLYIVFFMQTIHQTLEFRDAEGRNGKISYETEIKQTAQCRLSKNEETHTCLHVYIYMYRTREKKIMMCVRIFYVKDMPLDCIWDEERGKENEGDEEMESGNRTKMRETRERNKRQQITIDWTIMGISLHIFQICFLLLLLCLLHFTQFTPATNKYKQKQKQRWRQRGILIP